jgi:hypothetical protein
MQPTARWHVVRAAAEPEREDEDPEAYDEP